MHPSPSFRDQDRQRLAALVDKRGFALVVSARGGMPVAAHAPVLLAEDGLRFHLSINNPLVSVLEDAPRALAVISLEDAYVSPDWYAAADQVPTWNYRSVEIEGLVRTVGHADTRKILDDLAARFEADLAPKPPWTRAKMTPSVFEAMLGGIVGFKMVVERLQGVAKLSQNKPPDEIARVARQLARRPDEGSRAIAALMTPRASGQT